MEALNFFRLWRAITSFASEMPNEEDEEDSFFELEFINFDRRIETTPSYSDGKKHGEFFSKRRILPIESSSSPISPAPRFRVFMFRKSKSVSKTEHGGNRGIDSFAVELKMKDLEPNLARDLSSRKNSKRFAKDVIRKYLKLVRPLYVKVSKRRSGKVLSVSSSSLATAPASRETHGKPLAGFRVVSRQLGKSKSASATAASPTRRRDDSLVQQHDGIQSAILHCKQSFNSSRDFAALSRSASAHDDKLFDSARHSSEQTSRASVSF